MYYRVSLLSMMVSISGTALTNEYCVDSSTELISALSESSAQAVDSYIKVKTGLYYLQETAPFSFTFRSSHQLTISGGWVNDECSIQTFDSEKSVFDGNMQGLVFDFDDQSEEEIYPALILNNLSINNGSSLDEEGGGVSVRFSRFFRGDVSINQLTFTGNQANKGSALYIKNGELISITNSLFYDNYSVAGDGTVYIDFQDENTGAYIINNTIANNRAGFLIPNPPPFESAGIIISSMNSHETNNDAQAYIANNIFWKNKIDVIAHLDTPIPLVNNNIMGFLGKVTEEGNQASDPLFVEAGKDYSLLPSSTMIDHGKNVVIGPLSPIYEFEYGWDYGRFDHISNFRVFNDVVDIGAFESPALVTDYIFSDSFD